MPEGEFKHVIYDRLTRTNAVLLLVDHQVGLVAGSRYPEPQDLRKNVVGLARASKILGLPIVVTTTMSDGMFGPLSRACRSLEGPRNNRSNNSKSL
jgi:nicotinamidase-related amidase